MLLPKYNSTFRYPYIVLVLLLSLLIQACSSSSDNSTWQATDNIEKVYLSITRTQGPTFSFNEDTEDYEDRVHNLAMLVFDSNTGLLVTKYFETAILQEEVSKTFKVKMYPGLRDFFFVANVSLEDLKGIKDKEAMNQYMTSLQDYSNTMYQGAFAEEYFPMSATYLKQTVSSGGTEENPRPFYPNNQETISLERVVAKIELKLTGSIAPEQIKSVRFFNAANQYSMSRLENSNTIESEPIELTPLKDTSNTISYRIYVPEVIIDKNTKWGNGEKKPINYFSILLTDNREYFIPIVSNGKDASSQGYLSFAQGKDNHNTEKPDYSIYRNQNYQLDVRISIATKDMEVSMQVLPWQVNDSQFDYDYAKYKVEVDPAPAGKIIELHQQSKAKIKFKLQSPAGALWQASITNGLHFETQEVPYSELEEGEVSGTKGIATNNATYVFYVVPTQAYDFKTHYTELYITVNGKEVPLVSTSEDEEMGTNHRYIFKQIE